MTWRRYALGIPLVIVMFQPANAIAETWWHGLEIDIGPFKKQVLHSAKDAELLVDTSPVEQGDQVAGYAVTSGFGPRSSPCPGCSRNHGGVDLATPVGTPLHAPAEIQVSCFWDDGGGGLVADIWIDAENYRALHLENCTDGKHPAGEVFAKTGATGNGTGPHLDWRQKVDGQWTHPSKGMLESALSGKPLKAALPVAFDIENADPSDEITAIFHAAINLGVTDPHQIAYILATAQHESASFSTLHEIGQGPGCGAGYDYDGWTGVGLVQLTWKGNFQKAQEKLGMGNMSTEQFCQEVATRPDVAATILVRGMVEGWFTGLALEEFITGGHADYIGARAVVNGSDRAGHIAAIASNYEPQVKQWLGNGSIRDL